MAKLPPPTRPPGTLDLLESAEKHPSDPCWRADALGRSRHSRLAEEMRPRLDDPDPERAELVCARIARESLRDYAPALILLSKTRRRRAQVLIAWTATLFDLARRPGLAGLDGDRLAQINAWDFQTEEALSGTPPGQPIFVAMTRADSEEAWPRQALDRIVAGARRLAVGRTPEPPPGAEETASAFLEALFGRGGDQEATALAPLLGAALGHPGETAPRTQAPSGWRRALSYVRRVVDSKRSSEHGPDRLLGIGTRLRLLVNSAVFG